MSIAAALWAFAPDNTVAAADSDDAEARVKYEGEVVPSIPTSEETWKLSMDFLVI